MAYDDTNTGVLFKKENRSSERAPNYEGNINVDGKDYRLAAWIKESKTGKKFMSLAVSVPTKPTDKPTTKSTPKQEPKPLDLSAIPDDIGF